MMNALFSQLRSIGSRAARRAARAGWRRAAFLALLLGLFLGAVGEIGRAHV
jgi:hypothetical protein